MVHVAVIRVENGQSKVEYFKYFNDESKANNWIKDFNSKEEHGVSYSYAKRMSFREPLDKIGVG